MEEGDYGLEMENECEAGNASRRLRTEDEK